MPATERERPLFELRIGLLVGALCAAACWAFRDLRHDDAFITFRYAENLARGLGPVFNPGERVLGTTAPGYMLFGALLYSVIGKEALPSAMDVIGCMAWGAQALAVFALLRPSFRYGVAALAALAVAIGAAGSAGFVALETNMVAACVMGSVVLAQRGRWLGGSFAAALAGLIRPDSYLFAILLGLFALRHARGQRLRAAIVFGVVTLPWQVFALAYYGSPLPLTITKRAHTPALVYLVHELRHPMAELLRMPANVVPVAVGWAVALYGAYRLARLDRVAAIVPAYGAAHLLAYFWLRPYVQHIWHLYPLVLTVLVLMACGLGALYEQASSAALRVLLLSTAGALLVAHGAATVDFARHYRQQYWFGARDSAYGQASAFLREHAKPDDVVAAIEVGTIGYDTGLRMYDWGGLVTPSPELHPTRPRISFVVLDEQYAWMAEGLIALRDWDVNGFRISLFTWN
jgi:arabinofuranosyltransferase